MSDKNNTLLILTPGFAKDESDTTCIPLQQIFLRAIKENYSQVNIIIISFQYPFETGTYQWHGMNVISFGGKNKDGLRRRLLWQRVNKKLKKIASEEKIIGVLSFWCSESALIGKKFADAHGLRHLCWISGQDARKENRSVEKIKPRADELVGLSDFILDEFEKNHGVRPAHIIPPGIDTRYFDPVLPEKDIDLLSVGSLIKLKQYDVFLEVIATIKKKLPNIKAVLIGEGSEKERLEQLIFTLGLEKNVTLAGELPHREVLKVMQRSKVFLHTSSYEGFGVVCIEALYAGSSVISFCKPMKEEIKNWHIVDSAEEMGKNAIDLLEKDQNIELVLFNSIVNTAKKFMGLFGY
ncbi:MAG: glycosyltransferase family 4 protein [Chitinophagaceae bacterium]